MVQRFFQQPRRQERHMWSYRKTWLVILAVFLGLVNMGPVQSVGQRMLILLTPKEAAQLRLTKEEWQPAPRARAPSFGPRIVIKRPPLRDATDGPIIETTSPTDILIFFEENRAPVDRNSLQIEAKKWLFTVSLTGRLRPYIQGTSLQAKGVEVPAGLFVIQIEIADVAGAKTVGTYRLMARGQ
jgi:hypothetical protein